MTSVEICVAHSEIAGQQEHLMLGVTSRRFLHIKGHCLLLPRHGEIRKGPKGPKGPGRPVWELPGSSDAAYLLSQICQGRSETQCESTTAPNAMGNSAGSSFKYLGVPSMPRQALRTLSRARSWSGLPVLGAISWAFIVKSYQNL